MNLNTRNDVFLYRDVQCTAKPKDNTTRASSGGSSRSTGGGSF